MCCMQLGGNTGRKNDAKNRHLRTIPQLCRAISSSQLSHVSTIWKNFLSSNISPTCPYNMATFGPLAAEICWRVWGTLANFNRFRVLASLLQRRCSPEAKQTLHDVWTSPRLVHYVYIFEGSCPLREFCHVQNSFCMRLRSIVQLCLVISSQLRHLWTIRKKTC